MLNPKNLLPGEEQHEYYKDRVKRKCRCQYDYRAADGELFSCIRLNLEACHAARDEWLAASGRN